MTGFRDRNWNRSGTPHTICLGGVALAFNADGLLVDPTEDQVAAMTADSQRRARFEKVELPKPSPEQPAEPPADLAAQHPTVDDDAVIDENILDFVPPTTEAASKTRRRRGRRYRPDDEGESE